MIVGYKGNLTKFIADREGITTKEAFAKINNFYTLGIYAQDTKLPLTFLKELKLETGNNDVKIPYFDEDNQEIAVKRLRKNFNGTWQTGSKANLYGLWKLKEFDDNSYIVLTKRRRKCTSIMDK